MASPGTDAKAPWPSVFPGLLPWETLVLVFACGLYACFDPLAGFAAAATLLYLLAVFAAPLPPWTASAAALAAGFALAVWLLPPPAPAPPDFVWDGTKARISGRIEDIAFRPNKRLEITLAGVSALRQDAERYDVPGRVVWIWEDPPAVPAPGDQATLTAKLLPAGGFANPGEEYQAFMRRVEGISFRIFTVSTAAVGIDPADPPSRLWDLRLKLRSRILGGDQRQTDGLPPPGTAVSPGRAVVLALLMGDRFYLETGDLDRVRRATLTHTLALAGLHLGFVAAMGVMLAFAVGFVLPRSALILPRPKLAVILGAPLIALYLWLGQCTPSLTRAALMFASWGALLLCNRSRVLLDGLFLAMAVILAVSPLAVFDLRFALSVTAVAGIAGLFPLARALCPGIWGKTRARRLLAAIFGLVWVSACAQLGVLPVSIQAFNEFSPHLILNAVWIPVMGFLVMPAAFAGLAACLAPWDLAAAAGQVLLDQAGLICDGFLGGLAWLDAKGLLDAWPVLRPDWPGTAGFYLLLVLAATALWTGARRLGPAALGLTLVLAPHVIQVGRECLDRVSLTMLDVGQGQALLIEAPGGRRVLVDGGGFRGEFDIGRNLIAPLLTANRPASVDLLVMTHPDRDHLLGLIYPLGWMRVDRIAGNGDLAGGELGRRFAAALARSGLTLTRVAAGDDLHVGAGVRLEVLGPEAGAGGGVNERSVVARLVWKDRGLALLSGDIGAKGIARLLASGADLSAFAMTAPHHGSKKSVSAELLARVGPRLALVSAGAGNQWGFPTSAARQAFAAAGAEVYATSKRGAITLTWDDPGKDPAVTAQKDEWGRTPSRPWERLRP